MAERFIRTLKEQLLWLQTLETVEELRQALLEFKERFTRHWLLRWHGLQHPPKRVLPEGMPCTTDPGLSDEAYALYGVFGQSS